MKSLIRSVTNGKKVLILGYGREGKSSLRFISEHCPELPVCVADADEAVAGKNPELLSGNVEVICGPAYLDNIRNFDLIIKSPGVSLKDVSHKVDPARISSQTDLFLRAYSGQVAGITGTKGKSTTSTLLFNIIKTYTDNTLLAGNIGIPLFDLVPEINPETRIVCELSSHQLEYISKGPHIAVLLNLFQEHLDHYRTFYDYQMAKLQIGLRQSENDFFLWTASDANLRALLSRNRLNSRSVPVYQTDFEGNGSGRSGENIILRLSGNERILMPAFPETRLKGSHNLINISIAASAAALMHIPYSAIQEGIKSFIPLEHRIEFVGTFGGKHYYNDSISTIPEATIAAVETLKKVDTLILGGYDRGIDYNLLTDFLMVSPGIRPVFTGPAGKRMMEELISKGKYNHSPLFFKEFEEAVLKAGEITPAGGNCLLSPAASSYDRFRNFEERGKFFKEIVSK